MAYIEDAINRRFRKEMATDDALCKEIWEAIAERPWRHEDGTLVELSDWAAADFVARMRGRGSYKDWLHWDNYNDDDHDRLSSRVKAALVLEGWREAVGREYGGLSISIDPIDEDQIRKILVDIRESWEKRGDKLDVIILDKRKANTTPDA